MLARWLLLLILLTPSCVANAADWIYTVRPDDRLWNLAEQYCGDYAKWRDLARYNQLSDPARLVVGSRLKFPIVWLLQGPVTARLVYRAGKVTLAAGNSSGERSPAVGAELNMGTTLRTGADSFATVQFADGSYLRVNPDSKILFDRMSAYGNTGMVDTRLRIIRGGVESKVEPQRGFGSIYRITTPLGVAAVRGTDFRARAGPALSYVETLSGGVRFDGGRSQIEDVESGFGLVASAQGNRVSALLEAPQFRNLSSTTAGLGQLPMGAQVEWAAVAGATRYLVRLYEVQDGGGVVSRHLLATPSVALAAVAAGDYRIGVLGITEVGLQGIEQIAAVRVLDKLLPPAKLQARQVRRSQALAISWAPVAGAERYRVRLETSSGDVIERESIKTKLQLSKLDYDNYSISVRAVSGGKVSEPTPSITQVLARPTRWQAVVAITAALIAFVLVL